MDIKLSYKNIFLYLIIFGIPFNLYINRFYDNYWTIGEWLISYAGGFVRRGLPGEVIYYISRQFLISPIILVWILSVFSLILLALLLLKASKDLFNSSFILSHLLILGPIAGNYLVRKDSFLVLLYGLSLLVLKKLFQKKLKNR